MTPIQLLLEATGTSSLPHAAAAVVDRAGLLFDRRVSSQDLLEWTRTNGIETQFVENAAFEGRYRQLPSGDEIVLRRSANTKRLTFTLAHEIGHCLANRWVPGLGGESFRGLGRPEAVHEEERIADAVAAEVLIPGSRFRLRLLRSDLSFSALHGLRREFGVSLAAVMRRVADVSRQLVILINVVPQKLIDVRSSCMVDEASFAIPDVGFRSLRDQVRLEGVPRFDQLRTLKRVQCVVNSPIGRFEADFEIRSGRDPFPNADLFASIRSNSVR